MIVEPGYRQNLSRNPTRCVLLDSRGSLKQQSLRRSSATHAQRLPRTASRVSVVTVCCDQSWRSRKSKPATGRIQTPAVFMVTVREDVTHCTEQPTKRTAAGDQVFTKYRRRLKGRPVSFRRQCFRVGCIGIMALIHPWTGAE